VSLIHDDSTVVITIVIANNSLMTPYLGQVVQTTEVANVVIN